MKTEASQVKNLKLHTEPMTREQRYDNECTKLEIQVSQGQMSIGGAIARAFILGCNYQAECNQETAENEAHGAALEARESRY